MQGLSVCGSAPGSTVGSPGSILIGTSLCYQVALRCSPVMDEFTSGDTGRIWLYNTRAVVYTSPGLIKCLRIVLF